jgi:hypothetical protein
MLFGLTAFRLFVPFDTFTGQPSTGLNPFFAQIANAKIRRKVESLKKVR